MSVVLTYKKKKVFVQKLKGMKYELSSYQI
jgi:hypothetical protein